MPPLSRVSRPALLALLAVAPGCGAPSPTPDWHDAAGYRWRALTVSGGAPGFTRMTEQQTGIAFTNTVSDSLLLANRILGQGAGVALGDVDGDGLVDVFLARTEGPNRLYRNLGGWRFVDISDSAGVAAPDRFSTGAALVDLDGDGDLDLILLSTLGPNAVFLNDGHGHFTERRDLGLDPAGKGGTTVALADVDGDGWLDLYVANYKPYTPIDRIAPQDRAFTHLARRDARGQWEVRPEYRRDYKLVNREDMGGLSLSIRAEPDQFYRNEQGRLVPVPFTSGAFRDPAGKPLREAAESFGLDARFADLNGDGAPDLYVVNDFEDPDQLWLNDGRGGFRLADWTVQRQTSNSGMGADVADFDGNGQPDLFEVDMLANDSHHLKTERPTHTAVPKRPGAMEVQLQQQRNTLFLNRGDGTFAEASAYAGVAASGWSWSTLALDVDLDGRPDLLIANGHVRDVMDADTQERLEAGWSGAPWQRHLFEYPRLPLANVAYRNRGDSTFEDVSQAWGFGAEPDISHALAAADLDGDGDLDVVVNRLGAPALVLRNNAGAPRIAIRLRGQAPNTQAVGALLRVSGAGVPSQQREIAAGGLYLSHSDYLASFATGTARSVRVEVRWRDGRITVLDALPPNREYEIREPERGPVPAPAAAPQVTPESAGLFEDASALLGGHRHSEDRFDDWDRQYLLPEGLGELGPGVSWFDYDRDGREDLLIGAGRGGRLGVFHNTGGRFAAVSGGGLARWDLTSVLGLSEPGGTRLLLGVSTWEARTLAEMQAQPAVVSVPVTGGRPGSAAAAVIPSHESAVGPLALADYDGDGDLDLFVGGRAIAMRYPEPASSGLFRNEGGRFVLDSANSGVLRGVGLVSAALFTDLDGDGYPELLLARDWGPVLLLHNDGHGHFSVPPDGWGLTRWTGRWNGIASGDLDGDGRLDLVVTGWGRNTAVQADSTRPLWLVHGDFGTAGEREMLLAQFDPRLQALAPLTSYERLRPALRGGLRAIPSFTAYADAPLDRVLGWYRGPVERLEAISLGSMAWLNRGDHLEPLALPHEAQLAPAFYAGVADFDGDGHEDLFLGQNFSPTAVGTQRYDAGRGLLALGDGHGGLRPLSGPQSGLRIYGDQRGAAYADYDGDGRLDLAVSQNGAATRLFHNRGAKPGLRVRLQGPPGNPDGIGAQLRVLYADGRGPVREVQAGSGYWSQNGAVQVLGLERTPTAVWVRWPGGKETTAPVPGGARELVIRP